MGWVIATALVFGILVALRGSVTNFGTWYSPITLYYMRWSFLVFLFQLNFIDYSDVQTLTWFIIAGSILAFTAGAVLPMLMSGAATQHQPDHIRRALICSIDRRKLQTSTVVLFCVGLLLFSIYILNVPGSPNPIEMLSLLSQIRGYMKEETIPGFHYFYIMEVVVALGFLQICLWRKLTPWWVAVLTTVALISLLYTTAKVNVAKSIVWCFFILIYLELFNLAPGKVIKWVAYMTVAVLGFFVISVLNEPSDMSAVSDLAGTQAPLMLAYMYMSIPIGVFDKLLLDSAIEPAYGAYMFGPILKLLSSLGLSMDIPSHIGDFYETPIPANIATYLDLMFKDFGFFGTILIPFIFGFVSSYFFRKLLAIRITLFIFLFNTMLALMVFSSTSAANYMKPSYWFQFFIILVLSKYVEPQRQNEILNNTK